jgi:anthranilate/para-aminobenzoate synthase component I
VRVTAELDSLAELEPALRSEGFFGRDDVVAHVYIGYRSSDGLRRSTASAPPEPCPLPVVAYSFEPLHATTGSYSIGTWHASWSEGEYADAVEVVRASIAEGDVYQVNLVQHLSADFDGDPLGLARALAPLRPLVLQPIQGDGWTIVSASPELLLERRGSRIRTSPIKGTRPAGVPVESAKDAAEHVMIVDLERNDLSRVAKPGSVRSPAFRTSSRRSRPSYETVSRSPSCSRQSCRVGR